ncbi:MAG TPA: hypothetical protein VLG49_05820 [Rhabdochlamydiaceae bacterium]|nr:hypothetical protein [Rhabdochlamydiaceae bacterium]
MNLLIPLFILFSISGFSNVLHFPQTFTVKEKGFSWNPRFEIEAESEKIGCVQKKLISLGSNFKFSSADGELLATTKAHYYSWGITADVYDGLNHSIGWIEEKIPTWFSPGRFHIFNTDLSLVAVARMNFWGTKFMIQDPHAQFRTVAVISRPWLRCFKNKWTIRILDPESISPDRIDPRMLILTVVYQSDGENLKRREHTFENSHTDSNNVRYTFCDRDLNLYLNELMTELTYYVDDYFLTTDEINEDSEEKMEEDEEMANVPDETDPNDDEICPDDTLIAQEDFKMLKERARLIHLIKTLEMGIEILQDPNIEIERRQTVCRLLKQYKRHCSI